MALINDYINNKTFIIAEAGVNHNGSVETAKKMIDMAVGAGVDAIKFQTFKTEKLVTKSAKKAEYQKQAADTGEFQFSMLKKLELSFDAHKQILACCQAKGIMFISTPFDFESVDLLENLSAKLYKIGSGDLTNMPLLKYIARKNKPIVLSTGMAEIQEIEEAVGWIRQEGNTEIALLHCTTSYPARFEDINLRAMAAMKDIFKLPTGYSDHTSGIEASLAAVSMGAVIIEKHFTLNKSMEGPDHKASLDPTELKAMVAGIRNIEKAIGDGLKRCMPNEESIKKVARKSVVSARDISEGEILGEEHITVKRPGIGIEPKFFYELLGARAIRSVKADTPLTWDMIEKR